MVGVHLVIWIGPAFVAHMTLLIIGPVTTMSNRSCVGLLQLIAFLLFLSFLYISG
ncbi:hypothetical protein BKA69DRAFT_1090126 [Paraphysoderma sedebokerense]|nr:hypothetical protein BKA69DRAFT_1090126 [Paraphysoderma sedebokerense]